MWDRLGEEDFAFLQRGLGYSVNSIKPALIVSGIKCIVIFWRVVAKRRGRREVRLSTTFRESVKVATSLPIAIAPTPSGPSAVRVASVEKPATSILVAFR
jgi:hypothetical protein